LHSLFLRKTNHPFSITLSTPTCDLINIYASCLPQGGAVQDVVSLLIGATRRAAFLSSQPCERQRVTTMALCCIVAYWGQHLCLHMDNKYREEPTIQTTMKTRLK
jgi:hypothetical protein